MLLLAAFLVASHQTIVVLQYQQSQAEAHIAFMHTSQAVNKPCLAVLQLTTAKQLFVNQCLTVLQLTTARQLSKRSKGEGTVILGPGGLQGVTVGHKTQFKRCSTMVNVEVLWPNVLCLHCICIHPPLLPAWHVERSAGRFWRCM